MASRMLESRVLSDRELISKVFWPLGLSADEIRRRIQWASRFIDFDDTIVVGGRPRDPFCSLPLHVFLKQEPFLVQTWGPKGAVQFFSRRGDLPKPTLIISPPPIRVARGELWFDPMELDPSFSGDGWVWKDLKALGIDQGDVYDDTPHFVWAPGCRLISDFSCIPKRR